MATVCTIDHLRRTNPGGVGGAIQLGVLEASSPGKIPTARIMSADDVDEHLQKIAAAETALVNELTGKTNSDSVNCPRRHRAFQVDLYSFLRVTAAEV